MRIIILSQETSLVLQKQNILSCMELSFTNDTWYRNTAYSFSLLEYFYRYRLMILGKIKLVTLTNIRCHKGDKVWKCAVQSIVQYWKWLWNIITVLWQIVNGNVNVIDVIFGISWWFCSLDIYVAFTNFLHRIQSLKMRIWNDYSSRYNTVVKGN